MIEKFKKHRTKIILTFVISLAILFRFYKLPEWFFFGMDQEYEAFIARNIVTGKHLPLIGVNASDTGLYLGPAFIYFASIPYALFSGNPLGWAIVASIFGVLVSLLIYKIGILMFSRDVGILGSLFYASSFLTSFYDRQFWNPTLVPFFSLVIGFLLFRILKNDAKSFIFLGLIFGLSIQSHLSLLIFLPLIFYVVWVRRKIFKLKTLMIGILLFLLTQTPIILFDLRHDFINTKAFLKIVTNINQTPQNLSNFKERTNIFRSSLGRFFWVPAPVDLFVESGNCRELGYLHRNAYPEGIIISIMGILIFFWWYFKNKQKVSYGGKIILGIIFLTGFFILFYNRLIFEYYFLFSFPWLAILFGLSCDFILKKQHGSLIIAPAILLFIFLNLFTLFNSNTSYSFEEKKQAIEFVKNNIPLGNYTLEALGECTRFGGYRYLFDYYFKAPSHSYMDSYFDWLYQYQLKNVKSNNIVLLSLIDPRANNDIISKWEKDKIHYLSSYKLVNEARFGKISVFILAAR